MVASMSDTTASFGFRDVPEAQKEALVREVFSSVASKYDLMNDLMSAGVHRLWKDAFVEWLNPQPGWRVLDVAGGTGDIAFRIADVVRKPRGRRAAIDESGEAEIVVCDINADMVGRGRAPRRGQGRARHRMDHRRRRGAADPRCQHGRLYDRLRHPQRDAYRQGAGRGAPRAEAGRPVPVPGILPRRRAGAGRALRRLFAERAAPARRDGRRRRRSLSLSRRKHPPLPAATRLRQDDRAGRPRPGEGAQTSPAASRRCIRRGRYEKHARSRRSHHLPLWGGRKIAQRFFGWGAVCPPAPPPSTRKTSSLRSMFFDLPAGGR